MGKGEHKGVELSPYVFTVLLAGFGIWCFYDGWLNAEMREYLLFNRITSIVLLLWAAYDFRRIRRHARKQETGQAPVK